MWDVPSNCFECAHRGGHGSPGRAQTQGPDCSCSPQAPERPSAAGGSYIDLCFAWGVTRSTFYSERGIIWPTIETVDLAFDMSLPLHDADKRGASCM